METLISILLLPQRFLGQSQEPLEAITHRNGVTFHVLGGTRSTQ